MHARVTWGAALAHLSSSLYINVQDAAFACLRYCLHSLKGVMSIIGMHKMCSSHRDTQMLCETHLPFCVPTHRTCPRTMRRAQRVHLVGRAIDVGVHTSVLKELSRPLCPFQSPPC